MVSVYLPASSATRTTTAPMALMKLPAPSPPAALAPSSATTRCVCRACGVVMETRTVQMGLMSGRRTVQQSSRRPCAVPSMTSSVLTGSASTAAGSVTETWTARIDQMRSTAVSIFFLSFSFFKFNFALLFSHYKYLLGSTVICFMPGSPSNVQFY